jgi:hypothetical protein
MTILIAGLIRIKGHIPIELSSVSTLLREQVYNLLRFISFRVKPKIMSAGQRH